MDKLKYICICLFFIFLGPVAFGQVSNNSATVQKKPLVRIYPNPSKAGKKINISISGMKEKNKGEEVLVALYNIFGKLVYSKVILLEDNKVLTAIDPKNRLSPGVYLVKGSSKNELFQKKLVIKE